MCSPWKRSRERKGWQAEQLLSALSNYSYFVVKEKKGEEDDSLNYVFIKSTLTLVSGTREKDFISKITGAYSLKRKTVRNQLKGHFSETSSNSNKFCKCEESTWEEEKERELYFSSRCQSSFVGRPLVLAARSQAVVSKCAFCFSKETRILVVNDVHAVDLLCSS